MTKPEVAILDYGSGNIRSAEQALVKAGASVVVSDDLSVCLSAAGLVVPGVGAFEHCVRAVIDLGAARIIDQRLVANRPVFGICVGMQMMFETGVEGGSKSNGLGQWPGRVEKLTAKVTPHMGWNSVTSPNQSVLFNGLSGEYFYFVHSYAVMEFPLAENSTLTPPVVSYTEYEKHFVSAVENGPLTAVQFHPEKSGDAGIELLRNWIGTL